MIGAVWKWVNLGVVLRFCKYSMSPCVRWNHMSSGIFSGGKSYFRFLMFRNGSKNQYLGFQRISRKSVEVYRLIFDLSRDQTFKFSRAKISRIRNMLGFTQYGSRLFGIDASSDPSNFCDDWPSKSWFDVKFQNQKLAKMANLTNEKGEFAFAISRLCPPPRLGTTHNTLYHISFLLLN